MERNDIPSLFQFLVPDASKQILERTRPIAEQLWRIRAFEQRNTEDLE